MATQALPLPSFQDPAFQQQFSQLLGTVTGTRKRKQSNAFLAAMLQLLQRELSQREALLQPTAQALIPLLFATEGFSPEVMAALRGRAIEGTAGRFEGLRSNLRQALARRGVFGGQLPAGGEFARQLGFLGAAEESERAGALREIEVGSEQQRLQNLFQAAQRLLGGAGILQPQTFAGLTGQAAATRFRPSAGLEILKAAIAGGSAAGAAFLGKPGG